MATSKDIKVNNKYNLQNGKLWGEVLEVNDKTGMAKVRLSDGSVTSFGLYEMAAWINSFVLIAL